MKSMIKTILVSSILTSMAWIPLGAQVLSSCEQWASYSDGNYCVYNNKWGENAGAQCITATTTTAWSVRSNQTGSGVKTYPNSSKEPLGVTVGSITALTSSMNTTSPGTGDYNVAWDIWAPTEIMIWIAKYGSAAPWGSFVETATIGGVTWDVYKNGYPGFIRQSNTNSLTVNIKPILDYCVQKGWISSTGILSKVQGGFEISSTGGQELTYTMNSYSVSITSSEPIEQPPKAPPASETPVTGAWYKILNAKSGKAIEVIDSSTADSANVQIWDYKDGLNQQWSIEDAGASGPGYFKIVNRNSAKILQVADWSTADGGNINQNTFADYQNNQMWTLTKDGNYYELVNRNSGKLADVVSAGTFNGTRLHQWTLYTTDAASQRWSFISVGSTGVTTPPTPVPSATPTSVPTTAPGARGDTNGDGSVTIVDALLIAQAYVGLNPANYIAANADANCSGGVDIIDALLVAQYYVGLISQFC
jgi:hypothetical protein